MAFNIYDNMCTKSFTPKEPSIELLDAASEKNIIVCLCKTAGRNFIANKLIQHIYNASDVRPGRIALYVSDSPKIVKRQAGCLRRLTNLNVAEFHDVNILKKKNEWKESLKYQVLIMTTQIAVMLFKHNDLIMADINLLIVHNCHCILKEGPIMMKKLMKYYFLSDVKPKVLGLASSLFSSGISASQMEAGISQMEDLLNCNAETFSNIVSTMRYNPQPSEFILEYHNREQCSLDELIEKEIFNAIKFLRDHRFNLDEMYEGYADELQNIPDPTYEPEKILNEFWEIYQELGPWSADRAALVFLIYIEKLKVTTPYERHFLLLCMISSVILKIRAILDDFFEDKSDREKIYKYTSPKILRLIEILRKFQPEKIQSDFDYFSDSEDEVPSYSKSSSKLNNTFITNNKNSNVNGVVTNESVTEFRNCESVNIQIEKSNCQCQAMTDYLLKRLDSPEWKNLCYKDVIIHLKKNKSSKNVTIHNNNNIIISDNIEMVVNSDSVHSSKLSAKNPLGFPERKKMDILNLSNSDCNIEGQMQHEKSIKKGSVKNNSNSHIKTEVQLPDEYNRSVDFLQKKNGFIPIDHTEISVQTDKKREGKNLRDRHKKKFSFKTNAVENYLQCQEFLLLPKFKIDKYARYERSSAYARMKGIGQEDFLLRQIKNLGDIDSQQLCGLIFVERKFIAKVLFQLLNDLKQCDEDFSFLSIQFTIGKLLDTAKDPKAAESEHRKQELVLKRFRTKECNLLIGTSFLEEGIDLPKCNLVIRFDVPVDYRSYLYTKERARTADSLLCFLVNHTERDSFIEKLAECHEIEQILLKKSRNLEPSEEEEKEADLYVNLIKPFCPLAKINAPHIDLSTAITLVNRYCAKLPSDTFTRLTPIWNLKSVHLHGMQMFICSIRLPINSPVKQEIEGYPMPTSALARRFAAFQCCQLLHFEGELDDSLQPISKESFWLREEEQLTTDSEEREEMIPRESIEPRPGTTKRRQFYYKRIAESLTDCRPAVGKKSFLYEISMSLTYPLPEEQNTRGRKLHAPEDSLRGFGILTCKTIPSFGAFPIFTRSGEVEVKLQLAQSAVLLSETQIDKIVAFIHFTFTSVLRLQKYLMMFDPHATENSYFIVPTKRDTNSTFVEVDWEFLELIYEKKDRVPTHVDDEVRKNLIFDPQEFEDAVVSPWYRNQDQPQYFYVAEICYNLSPKSSFPGLDYDTFEEYYFRKYGIQIQNSTQALLDVDHTSARLNFLTPRYVNRKGVALPTTSEEKKRAKRENLEQKQILVPELCNIHPFPGTLWRKAVCLPCILHRINALLLADEVRRTVANEIAVGIADLDPNFKWKPLDFGWSLSDVSTQSKAAQQKHEKKEKIENKIGVLGNKTESTEVSDTIQDDLNRKVLMERTDFEKANSQIPWMEIGTWSNDMACTEYQPTTASDASDMTDIDMNYVLSQNLTMLKKSEISEISDWNNGDSSDPRDMVLYGSPTGWLDQSGVIDDMSDFYSEDSYCDDYLSDTDRSKSDSECGRFRIEFMEDNVAEAIENGDKLEIISRVNGEENEDESDEQWIVNNKDLEDYEMYIKQYEHNTKNKKEIILKSGMFYSKNEEFNFVRSCNSNKYNNLKHLNNDFDNETSFGSSDNTFPQLIEIIPEDLNNLPLTNIIIKSLEEEKQRKRRLCKFKNQSSLEKIELKCRTEAQNNFVSLHDEILARSLNSNDTQETKDNLCENFSFDEQPDLTNHLGPSPGLILQAMTMSNANDGINLERLETIGDSFLKYAITVHLYCTYENVHEGKLSHLRSKQVSNYNLYRLGYKKVLGESIIATKFEPHDNWLPPCYYIPRELERALIKTGLPASHWNRADLPSLRNLTDEEICQLVKEKGEKLGIVNSETVSTQDSLPCLNLESMPCFIPYNLMTQHSIPDKSIADCVEALIGAYLVACGPRGALLFMSWLGIKVLPKEERYYKSKDEIPKQRLVGSTIPVKITNENEEVWHQVIFGELKPPKPPLLHIVPDPEGDLERLLRGFDTFENEIGYHFQDRSYLLQALTHASFFPNRLTDCYQRLEFLGDAVLDYLITRHLYEDPRHHSPGALTDLRSALVNNTIFASLAVRHNFHKYFRHLCPTLNEVIEHFVRIQEENGHSINEEFYLMAEEECEEAEDVEVPKALGDLFESVAGAIFLDSGMSLDAVWRVYYRIMKKEIELFSTSVPKSPIRELFELEPETAQFGKPEKLADGKRVRVTVEVFGKGLFNGIGRNYRIAKCTAAKCALKKLKRQGLLMRRK